MALPPRRPRSVRVGDVEPGCDQRFLGFDSTHEAHRQAEDQGGALGPGGQPVEEMEEGRRRVADDHDGALEVGPPQLDRGGAARRAEPSGQVRDGRIIERAADLDGGGQAVSDDPGQRPW